MGSLPAVNVGSTRSRDSASRLSQRRTSKSSLRFDHFVLSTAADGHTMSLDGSVSGSSRRVRAQTGHRASGGAQNQFQRRIGRPRETTPGSVLGRKVDRLQPPGGAPELPQGVPEALRGAILEIFLKKGARTSGFSKMQSLQRKTLIFEFPGNHLGAISKRLNDF